MTHRRVFRRPLTAGEAWSFVDAVLASPALGILVPGERHRAVAQRIGHDVSPGGEIRRFGIAAPHRKRKR